MERRNGIILREAQWRKVAFLVTYRALFVHYLERGLGDRDAKLKAMAEVKGYLSAGSSSSVRALSAGTAHDPQKNSLQLSGQHKSKHSCLFCCDSRRQPAFH